MDDYKSRFETMGLGTGGIAATASSLQQNAQAFAQKAVALGEAAGMGGARVPMVSDPSKTMEKMMEKFITSKVSKVGEAEAAKEQKKLAKQAKKDAKKKDKKKKKKDKHKKKK